MITIKDQDFEMKQVKNLPFFDLLMPVIVNEGKDNERVDMKIVGYGMPFEACVKEIVIYRLNQSNKTYNLEQFVSDFISESEKIESLIEFTLPPLKKKKKNEDEDDEEDEDIIDESIIEDENN